MPEDASNGFADSPHGIAITLIGHSTPHFPGLASASSDRVQEREEVVDAITRLYGGEEDGERPRSAKETEILEAVIQEHLQLEPELEMGGIQQQAALFSAPPSSKLSPPHQTRSVGGTSMPAILNHLRLQDDRDSNLVYSSGGSMDALLYPPRPHSQTGTLVNLGPSPPPAPHTVSLQLASDYHDPADRSAQFPERQAGLPSHWLQVPSSLPHSYSFPNSSRTERNGMLALNNARAQVNNQLAQNNFMNSHHTNNNNNNNNNNNSNTNNNANSNGFNDRNALTNNMVINAWSSPSTPSVAQQEPVLSTSNTPQLAKYLKENLKSLPAQPGSSPPTLQTSTQKQTDVK
eukprot:749353-Hanusia_phi.AAC.1